ncbi:MAG: L-histidine N(alpha)-methyltransferase [Armatimonadota bacterium]|nr:L-histidine N(alpha)-methyltransferase [Armatimonadota bacterium]
MSPKSSSPSSAYPTCAQVGSPREPEGAVYIADPLCGWAGPSEEDTHSLATDFNTSQPVHTITEAGGRLTFTRHPSSFAQEPFAQSVLADLSAGQKRLSCSWFYDDRGSELFEQICDVPEYYLTRTERMILQAHAGDIASLFPAPVTLVELGSGSSIKTRLLIHAFHERQPSLVYYPIDISGEILRQSSADLLDQFPRLSVRAFASDYLAGLEAIEGETASPRLIVFLGSTIGNFDARDAEQFLSRIRQVMAPDDRLLLGFDLKKDPALIEAAYNDAAGVTAAFNKNLLHRINRELDGQFDPDAFDHHAPYQPESGRVEMRLVSRREQTISIGLLNRTFSFGEGEFIHTESCHKYSEPEMARLLSGAGLSVDHTWNDDRGWFAVSLLRPAGPVDPAG